jgi:hypothetical protein
MKQYCSERDSAETSRVESADTQNEKERENQTMWGMKRRNQEGTKDKKM